MYYVFNKYGYEREIIEQFRESLDFDGPTEICGIKFWPSKILEELDPIAYRCAFIDYLDMVLSELDTELDNPDKEPFVEEKKAALEDM